MFCLLLLAFLQIFESAVFHFSNLVSFLSSLLQSLQNFLFCFLLHPFLISQTYSFPFGNVVSFLAHFLRAGNIPCLLCHCLHSSNFPNLLCFLARALGLLHQSLQCCLFLSYKMHSWNFSNLLCFLSVILFDFIAHFLRVCSIDCFVCYCLNSCNFSTFQ